MVMLIMPYGEAYWPSCWSLRTSCWCLPLDMLKLTLQYGEAYVSATSAFVLCLPFVPSVCRAENRTRTNHEQNGNEGERTVNKPWTAGVGWAWWYPPLIGEGPYLYPSTPHAYPPYSPKHNLNHTLSSSHYIIPVNVIPTEHFPYCNPC